MYLLILSIIVFTSFANAMEVAQKLDPIDLYLAQENDETIEKVSIEKAVAIHQALQKIKQKFNEELGDLDYQISEKAYDIQLLRVNSQEEINTEALDQLDKKLLAICMNECTKSRKMRVDKNTNIAYAMSEYNKIPGITAGSDATFGTLNNRVHEISLETRATQWKFVFTKKDFGISERYHVYYDPTTQNIVRFKNKNYAFDKNQTQSTEPTMPMMPCVI